MGRNRDETRAITRSKIASKELRYFADRAKQLADEADEEEVTLARLQEEKGGVRARMKRIVRNGVQKLPGNAKITETKLRAARYRACVALCLTREEVLAETEWSLQELMATERYVRDEDDANTSSRDPGVVFGEYRERMMLCARELEDLGIIFRQSRQYSSLVNSVKAKAEIFQKIVDMGQELGLIKRQAKRIELDGKISYDVMERRELEVTIRNEVEQLGKIIELPTPINSPAAAVLNRLLPAAFPQTPRKPRVKKLAAG